MIKEAIFKLMQEKGIPYQYEEFQDVGEGIPDCYFVGEAVESPTSDESGICAGTFILDGWAKTPAASADLLEHQERIKRDFMQPVHFSDEELGAAVICYSFTTDVPSDAEGVTRREINLTYSEWSVI